MSERLIRLVLLVRWLVVFRRVTCCVLKICGGEGKGGKVSMYTISIRSRRIPVTVSKCARRDERDGDGRWVYRALPLVMLRYGERLICSTRAEVW